MTDFRASNVVVGIRSYRGAAIAALILVPLAMWALGEALDLDQLRFLSGPFVLIAAVSLMFGAAFLTPTFLAYERRGAIIANREGIFFAGSCLVARDAIRNVSVEVRTDGTAALHLFGPRSHRFVLSPAAAHGVVEALELDPRQRVATFAVHDDPLRSRRRRIAMRALVILGGFVLAGLVALVARNHELRLLLIAPLLFAYAFALPRLRRWTDVTLGADGIMLRHRGRLRSVALSEIAEQKRADNVVHVVLRDRQVVPLHFGALNDEKATAQREAFVSGLQHALARQGDAHDASEALLARGGRDVATWRSDVAGLAKDPAGFRSAAAVPPETLWRIAENVTADPSARAGAVAALQGRGEERERLRALAERTAQRDLRAALDAAADGATADEVLDAYDRNARS